MVVRKRKKLLPLRWLHHHVDPNLYEGLLTGIHHDQLLEGRGDCRIEEGEPGHVQFDVSFGFGFPQ